MNRGYGISAFVLLRHFILLIELYWTMCSDTIHLPWYTSLLLMYAIRDNLNEYIGHGKREKVIPSLRL